jgi:type I restriction enzyme M protein
MRRGWRRKAGAGEANAKPNGGVIELTKELWQAAVALRGSIEPADYKRYVLPIIFLRFLSLKYERRRAELERLIADPASDCHGEMGALYDPDEYRKAGSFIVPEIARWPHLVRHAQADDVKKRLDEALKALEEAYPEKLKGLLPPVFAASNMSRENATSLINLFARDVFEADHGGLDLIGRVYEYFIGEFASSEGKRGGEYFTPESIVRLLVAMLEPTQGVVFDPCCGSGGMFVQSDQFTHHNRQLSFVGQESKDFTWRLCRMNLFIHGLDGNIALGNSYFDDRHPKLKADYVLANPPFNDGAKGAEGWGATRIARNEGRLRLLGDDPITLSPRNANTLWMMHFLHHLKDGGTAGFVMATGELSNGELARKDVRRRLIEQDYVDCIVQLSGQLFANTQIPCCLWFLSKNRRATHGYRERTGEVLFIDGRKLGALIPGSRKQKQLSAEEIERVAGLYREFKRVGRPADAPGFCAVADHASIKARGHALAAGRYVGTPESEDEDVPFEERFPSLVGDLRQQLDRAKELDPVIRRAIRGLGFVV